MRRVAIPCGGIVLDRYMVTLVVWRIGVTLSLHWVWPTLTRGPRATYIDAGPVCLGWHR